MNYMLSGSERFSNIDNLVVQSRVSDHFECVFTALELQSLVVLKVGYLGCRPDQSVFAVCP